MKYGLIVFKETENLGDDIQSYAAKQFLPKVDYYIERDKINQFCPKTNESVKVIMSGWYTHDITSFPPSPFIEPLIISTHFTDQLKKIKPAYLDGIFIDYLKKHQPIGLRDDLVKEYLDESNVENYFSGCMTLTLKPFKNIEIEDKITLVDVDEEIIKKVKKTSKSKICIETHNVNKYINSSLSWEERMNNVEIQLKKYQSSKLVITSRLHVALPCLAIGTPVLLIYNDKDTDVKNRLGKYTEFLNYMNKKDFIKHPNYKVINRKEHEKYCKHLSKTVKDFLLQPSKDIKNENVELYKKYFVDAKQYYDKINNYEKENLTTRINELEKSYYKLKDINKSNEIESKLARHAALKYKEKIYAYEYDNQQLLNKINDIENKINDIENSRGYKFLVLFRKHVHKLKRIIKKVMRLGR